MCVSHTHTHVHCVPKIVPPSFCYNFDIRQPILIIFGRNVTKKARKFDTKFLQKLQVGQFLSKHSVYRI